MKKCDLIIEDEVSCRFNGLEDTDLRYLYKLYAIEVEGARFSPAVRFGKWDGKKNFFREDARTYTKLLDQMIPQIVARGYDIQLKADRRRAMAQVSERAHVGMYSHLTGYGGLPLEVRQYQCDAVNALIHAGSGWVIAATGAGKSVMTAMLSDIIGRHIHGKTMTIVPSVDLIVQTVAAFQMCGLDVGRYDGQVKDTAHKHIISSWQALQNHGELLQECDMVIVDEGHKVKAAVIRDLINGHGKHIAYRFGVTGTLPKPVCDQYELRCSVGEVHYEISARWLIDNGYLADLDIELIQTQESAEEFPDYASEKEYLARTEPRIERIAREIEVCRDMYGNTLVLVTSIKFGKMLAKQIPGSVFMYGQTDNATRQNEYADFDGTDGKIVICNNAIAATGISIDRIFCLVLVDSGKSFINAIQSVGRGLRRAKDKRMVYVKDVSSNLKWSAKHRRERVKWFTEATYPVGAIRKIKY